MRAYRHLKRANQLARIRRVRASLVNTPLSGIEPSCSRFFFGEGISNAELAIRQYLLARIGGARLNRALLYAQGSDSPVSYPLPRSWQDILVDHGFAVASWRCSVAWAGYVALLWAYGVLTIAHHLAIDAVSVIKRMPRRVAPYAYFANLTTGNLPRPCKDGRSHDVITWYTRWRRGPVATLCHNVSAAEPMIAAGVPVVPVPHALPSLSRWVPILRLAGWSVMAIFGSALDALRGRWWHAFLLRESTLAAKARLAAPGTLADDYLFHNSGHHYRPLWTYEAERRGSRILFYFYSASEHFKLQAGYECDRGEWGAMNWPSYLVWDDYQADLVRRATQDDPHIEVVGPIWFHSSPLDLPDIPDRTVAVFDVQPHRKSGYFACSTWGDLYDADVACRFLLDIRSALKMHGGVMAHKRKRHVHKWLYPKYVTLLGKLADDTSVITIDPDIAAARLVEDCAAVISMPFTSTAFIGKSLGKPSVFYDPLCVIEKSDRGSHGIPVVSGVDELRQWLGDILNSVAAKAAR